MQRVLVVGVETLVGGNLAKSLAQHHQVVGLASTNDIHIAGCQVQAADLQSPEAIQRELALSSPDLVVITGPAARSIWSSESPKARDSAELDSAVTWAKEVSKTGARLIVVSSDAVFHGPWMFHEEDCTGICQSPAAAAIRKMESQVQRCCPGTLIVRTNVFGWSPQPGGDWLETLMEKITSQSPIAVPAVNYATPIEASQFAEIVIQLWDRGLEGVYHAGGSERVNFVHFTHRLAQEFQLPRPKFQRGPSPELDHVFGQGETSLNSGKLRRAIGSPPPMLSESLRALREQAQTGERELLHAETPEFASHAA